MTAEELQLKLVAIQESRNLLQEEFNKIAIQLHRHDGAIALLQELVPKDK